MNPHDRCGTRRTSGRELETFGPRDHGLPHPNGPRASPMSVAICSIVAAGPRTLSYGAPMQAYEAQRATKAAMSIASALGLTAHDAVVLRNSNKLTLRLQPCEMLARVAPAAHQSAQLEVDVAQRLAEAGSPVAAPEAPEVFVRDGYVVTLWTYYEPVTTQAIPPADYAGAQRQWAGSTRSRSPGLVRDLVAGWWLGWGSRFPSPPTLMFDQHSGGRLPTRATRPWPPRRAPRYFGSPARHVAHTFDYPGSMDEVTPSAWPSW